MTTVEEIGVVEKIPCEIQQIEWRIPDFFNLARDKIYLPSPTFSVAGVSWQLSFWPRRQLSGDYMDLYLSCEALTKNQKDKFTPDAHREYAIEYYLGLKKCDGNVEHLQIGILKKNKMINTMSDFIKKTQILERKSVLVPDNILTIVCTMKWVPEVSYSSTQLGITLEKTKPLKLIRLDTLSKNFKDLFDDKETCDTTFKVKDKEFKAHRSVLIARSAVFAATFKHDTSEKQTGIITIPDCDPDSFPEFLEFLYCGRLEELSYRSALNLYYTSDKYDMEELKVFCIEYLMQCLTVENICEVVVFADKYDVAKLSSGTQEYFNQNVCEILETSEWENLLASNYRLANKLMKEMSKVKLK